MSRRDTIGLVGLRGATARRSFDDPEVFVRFKCDVHLWEFAYMGVVPHWFFSVTDTNGLFCLPAGLPDGRYVLAAAHPKAGETLQQMSCRRTARIRLNLPLQFRAEATQSSLPRQP